MPDTECNLYRIDKVQPSWMETANVVGYAWCVQLGAIVAGSDSAPQATAFVQTGNILADVQTWISAVMLALTGDADSGFAYPAALGATGYGTEQLPKGSRNTARPTVALAYTYDYQFGTLNIPPFSVEGEERVWYFKFSATDRASDLVPSVDIINQYITDHGAPPILQVLELNPE